MRSTSFFSSFFSSFCDQIFSLPVNGTVLDDTSHDHRRLRSVMNRTGVPGQAGLHDFDMFVSEDFGEGLGEASVY